MPSQTPPTGAGSGTEGCKQRIFAALNTLATRVFAGKSSLLIRHPLRQNLNGVPLHGSLHLPAVLYQPTSGEQEEIIHQHLLRQCQDYPAAQVEERIPDQEVVLEKMSDKLQLCQPLS
ncbi:hypothetical protein R3I94_000286 [Phoxinus phoxinus]